VTGVARGIGSRGFSWAARLASFRHAVRGIAFTLRSQHNAWIHLAATLVVCVAGWLLHVSAADWRWLVIAIVLVWVGEAMNTAFEHLCDVVSPQFHVAVEQAKDVAAGTVLICAVGAVLIGVLTLWPYAVETARLAL